MRIALVADLHANLPALRAVLDDVVAIGCEALWCAGDVVGRGPHPNEVVNELRALDVPVVQGNWDEAAGMDRLQTGTIWASADGDAQGTASLQWTIRELTDENRTWLRSLPMTQRLSLEHRSALLFHGSPVRQTEYLWEDRPSRTFARIASEEGDDLFCFGHSHEAFHKVIGASHMVAGGSVGCSTIEDPRARYAVIYVSGPDIVVGFRSVAYDAESVGHDLMAAGLSADLLRLPPVSHPEPANLVLSAAI